MATWPASGNTDWNTKMLAYLAIGHETDGTHNQEDWTPTSYAGEQSVTFPNGLIFKQGTESIAAGATDTVTFDDAFSTVISASVTTVAASGSRNVCYLSNLLEANIQIYNAHTGTSTAHWQVWGY